MPEDRWLAEGWNTLPAARILLDGANGEPFVVQTDMGLDAMDTDLTAAGWKKTAPRRLEALLMSAIPLPFALDERPVLPFYHSGMRPQAEFTRTSGPDARIVLRIWKSTVRIRADGTTRPVMLVSLARETLEPFAFGLSDLRYRPLDAVERSAAADEVVSALNPGGRLKAVSPRAGLTLLPVL
jgi:hypothetical protein